MSKEDSKHIANPWPGIRELVGGGQTLGTGRACSSDQEREMAFKLPPIFLPLGSTSGAGEASNVFLTEQTVMGRHHQASVQDTSLRQSN